MFSRTILLAAATLVASSNFSAVAFPDRVITFIVPFAAGGSTDVVARILAEHMSRTLGQQIVIETAVGAGGTVGTARAAKAAPDGHTVVVGSLGPNVAAVGMYNSLPYDPIKDFEPVIMSVLQPMVVITRKDLPVANFREFVAYLKANGSNPQLRLGWCRRAIAPDLRVSQRARRLQIAARAVSWLGAVA